MKPQDSSSSSSPTASATSKSKTLSQDEIKSAVEGAKFGTESDANSHLKQHGLSCRMGSDGKAEIFESSGNKVATVQTDSSGSVSNISY